MKERSEARGHGLVTCRLSRRSLSAEDLVLRLLSEQRRRRASAVAIGLGLLLILVGAIAYEPPPYCILLAGFDCPKPSPLPALAIGFGVLVALLGVVVWATGFLKRR